MACRLLWAASIPRPQERNVAILTRSCAILVRHERSFGPVLTMPVGHAPGDYTMVNFRVRVRPSRTALLEAASAPRPTRSYLPAFRSRRPRASRHLLLVALNRNQAKEPRAAPGHTNPCSAACASRPTSPDDTRSRRPTAFFRTNDDFGKVNGATEPLRLELVARRNLHSLQFYRWRSESQVLGLT